MFDTLNRQQQPYIQSGYGAMSRLNTLLGLGAGGGAPAGAGGTPAPGAGSAYRPTPSGGMDQRIPSPVAQGPSAQGVPQNMRLKQILALRAANGDSEAARVLQGI